MLLLLFWAASLFALDLSMVAAHDPASAVVGITCLTALLSGRFVVPIAMRMPS